MGPRPGKNTRQTLLDALVERKEARPPGSAKIQDRFETTLPTCVWGTFVGGNGGGMVFGSYGRNWKNQGQWILSQGLAHILRNRRRRSYCRTLVTSQ